MIDIDAIAEQHCESFFDKCCEDYKLECLVWETFADNIKKWRYWKEGEWDEGVVQNAFERLYEWDAEYLIADPKGCIEAYIASEQKDKS